MSPEVEVVDTLSLKGKKTTFSWYRGVSLKQFHFHLMCYQWHSRSHLSKSFFWDFANFIFNFQPQKLNKAENVLSNQWSDIVVIQTMIYYLFSISSRRFFLIICIDLMPYSEDTPSVGGKPPLVLTTSE